MIEFRLKDFSRINTMDDLKREKFITRAPIEIIKAIEMADFNNGQYLYHWIRKKMC